MLTRSARPSLAGPAPCSPRVRPVPPPSRARDGPSATAGGPHRVLEPRRGLPPSRPFRIIFRSSGVSRPHPVDDIYWAGHAVSRARFLSRSNPTRSFHQPPPCSACGKLPPGASLTSHLPPSSRPAKQAPCWALSQNRPARPCSANYYLCGLDKSISTHRFQFSCQ